MKLPILLTVALVAGVLTGREVDWNLKFLSDVMLYIMLFFIGFELAQKRKEVLKDLKEIGILSIALPMATLAGSALGGLLAGLMIPGLTARNGVLVASGCGWYSLTGPFLSRFSPELGLMGFLTNFMREITMLLIYPIVIRWVPAVAGISIGGATTMDSTLPLVRKFAGQRAGLIAFVHGFMVSLSVPLLLMLEAKFLM